MKKLLAVAAVLAVTSVNAEELKFGDLNYFLKQGQLNVAVDWDRKTEESEISGDKFEVDGNFIHTKFAYGFSDRLNAFVNLEYLFNVDVETYDPTATPQRTSFRNDGLQNPSFGANFRVMNQDDMGFNFDVGAVATVKLMDREVGSFAPNKEEGNHINPLYSNESDPRNTLEVNARLGKKWNEANEFYLLAGGIYHMDGEYKDLGSDDDVDMDSSLDFKLGAFYQYRPVYEFMMTLGLVGTRYGEIDFDNGAKSTADSHTDFVFTFNAKYLITEDFIAKFNFSQDRRSDYDIDNTEVENRVARSFGFGVDFLF